FPTRRSSDLAAGERVDAAVTNHEYVSVVIVDNRHQRLDWGARVHCGFDVFHTKLLGMRLARSQVLCGHIVAQDGDGFLAQRLGGFFLILVVSAADDQTSIKCRSNTCCTLYCKTR